MNEEFERLKKLVALANNNPNDNEANFAARKVCRILAEKKFSFIQQRVEPRVATVSTPPNSNDFYKKYYQPNREQNRYYKEDFDFSKIKVDFGKYSYSWFDEEIPKPKKEKKILKCSKCNLEQETAFVGPPQVYVCNKCIWEAYQQSKK